MGIQKRKLGFAKLPPGLRFYPANARGPSVFLLVVIEAIAYYRKASEIDPAFRGSERQKPKN